MKTMVSLVLSMLCIGVSGQNIGVNVNGATPNASALLDIDASALPADAKRGLLIPRISLLAKNSPIPVVNPATSLLVYNTNTAGTPPNNVVPGFYYWDGLTWVPLVESTTASVCPPGFIDVDGKFSIELDEHTVGIWWSEAIMVCHSLGARLCTPEEWFIACELGLPLNDMLNGWEWTSDVNDANSATAKGEIFCENMTNYPQFSPAQFRCCCDH